MPELTPKQVRELWAKDLEEGGHKQGIGRLYDEVEDSWCCLGRLEDLAMEHGVVPRRPFGRRSVPRLDVAEWVRLSDWTGVFDGGSSSLANLNDAAVPFVEIAAVIREEPPGLCKESS